MLRWMVHVMHLAGKELASAVQDRGMMIFIIWAFTGAIYLVTSGRGLDLQNATVGFADHDRSQLSEVIRDAIRPPEFSRPVTISASDVDRLMDTARFTFVIDVPPSFESDLLAGRRPSLQLLVDATAMSQAGNGTGYIAEIVNREIERFLKGSGMQSTAPISFTVRSFFNPNLEASRHTAVMEIVNNVCMISILLVGAAVVREREHGTIEHLLVMPVSASEIIFAKIFANGMIVLTAVVIALMVVVRIVLGIPINGSVAVYLGGAVIFAFSVMALGVMIATLTPSMPQFALLAFPTVIIMEVLSGGMTPIESMPAYLQLAMTAIPSTHYVKFSQSVLFRDAPFELVRSHLGWMAGLGAIYLIIALFRFRKMLASANGS
jgi:ABC-2 type transport system permease protein